MIDLSEKLTVVIKTFERQQLVKRSVSSLRRIHPTLQVIVADDSKNPVSFDDDDHTQSLHLPFDTGISFGRNRAIERVKTPYYLLIDDDICFEKDCNLESPVRFLEKTDFDIIGLRLINYRAGKGYCRGELRFAGIFTQEGDEMVHYIGQDRGIHLGYPLYDIINNCYVAKKSSTDRISFDENIKIGKEHGDYFLEAKREGLKITLSHESFVHHRPQYNENYSQFKKRSDEFRDYYFNKHGIKSEQTIGKNYTVFDKIRYLPQRFTYLFMKALGRTEQ